MKDEIPGAGGLAVIVVATLATGVVIAAIDGTILPLVLAGAGVLTGLWAVQAINRK